MATSRNCCGNGAYESYLSACETVYTMSTETLMSFLFIDILFSAFSFCTITLLYKCIKMNAFLGSSILIIYRKKL